MTCLYSFYRKAALIARLTVDNILPLISGDPFWLKTCNQRVTRFVYLRPFSSTDSQLKLWNVNKPHCLRSFKGHINEKNFVGLASNGDYVACGKH